MADQFNLQRYLDAQDGTYQDALKEIQNGEKESHWMWFVFPQVAGLGRSEMNVRYAISGIDEARAYLEHPVLGARLREISEALMAVEGRTALEIFGEPDRTKLRSSMTLFERAAGEGSVFGRVLEKYFDGERDERTIEILDRQAGFSPE